MMKLITENIEDIQVLTEETDGKKNYYIEGIFLQGDLTNRNGRNYPVNILEREVTKYNENFVGTGRFLENSVIPMVQPSILIVFLIKFFLLKEKEITSSVRQNS